MPVFDELLIQYAAHPAVIQINTLLDSGNIPFGYLKGVAGSQPVLVAAAINKITRRTCIYVAADREQAAYRLNDFENIAGTAQTCFFPSSFRKQGQRFVIDQNHIVDRAETLKTFLETDTGPIVVTYPEALAELVSSRSQLDRVTLHVKAGERVSIEFLTEALYEYGFIRTDFVYEPGQYAIRGGIVDIFSYGSNYPYRLDFFGEEVESIRSFDVLTQLSNAIYQSVSIVPNISSESIRQQGVPFFDYLPANAVWLIHEPALFKNSLEANLPPSTEGFENEMAGDFLTADQLKENVQRFALFEIGIAPHFGGHTQIRFDALPQPAFHKNFRMLAGHLDEKRTQGYSLYIVSDQEKQIERLNSIFHSQEINLPIEFTPLLKSLHEGFIDHELRLCLYTDHQLFDRYHKYKLRNQTNVAAKEAVALRELIDLNPGDFVVHIDHGIARFAGLEKTSINGKIQEALKLVYRDNDVLFVSIHALHRITKYKGKDSDPPAIYKLGSGAWQKLKQKTKSRVKDIARELIQLYAKRRTQKGHAFSHDTYLQQALEASFIYEDTPDQIKATVAVKADMEQDSPMDRLICGDVGFGKTEIAIRAAFKSVSDSKQVAVLVPTTILALQHYKTFSERLKDFPCTIEYVSRLRKTSEIKETLERLSKGQVDILIGTHRLVSKDIVFKDLGLLIIDEEQKFGVGVKEKLKSLKSNVDTLTLTATPIPRTLQFSLVGARDLSVISTPPPNRYPITTELHVFNEEIIAQAIRFEHERNGQIFFIHNRVQNIEEVDLLVRRLCPAVRTGIAHGQMEGPALEDVMLRFINHEFDVLIATSIIENGLDIPNANTIIINNAHYFGLSDLHQLRGRVGRSNKKAFCYLLAPTPDLLTPEARRRLEAINTFAELGSGLNIALQDLDIRGAGNLLGAEQSGFVSDIGFETYQRILDEAITELKDDEFAELYAKDDPKSDTSQLHISNNFVSDTQIETDLELLFPDSYIENITERLKLYRELDELKNEDEINHFTARLQDRFGKLPPSTHELLNVVRIRWLAQKSGIEKIVLKAGRMVCYFVSNPQSAFYTSGAFGHILGNIQRLPSARMKQSGEKLSLIFDQVKNTKSALAVLKQLIPESLPA